MLLDSFKHKFNINCTLLNNGASSIKSSAYATAPVKVLPTLKVTTCSAEEKQSIFFMLVTSDQYLAIVPIAACQYPHDVVTMVK